MGVIPDRKLEEIMDDLTGWYQDLVWAGEIEQAELLEEVIDRLDSLHKVIFHAFPERFQSQFICGTSPRYDSEGLPETVTICPAMGSDVFRVYGKIPYDQTEKIRDD